MRIGELSQRIGISERALRYYEEQGLLRPSRRPSGYREYSEADAKTVRRIRTLLSAGLGTSVIAEVLPCMVDDGDIVAPSCPELIPYLARERDRIDRSIVSCTPPARFSTRSSPPPRDRSSSSQRARPFALGALAVTRPHDAGEIHR